MEISIFQQFYSDNQENVNNAKMTVLKAMENPGYIQTLFQFLQSPESQSNPAIERMIQITILDMIRRFWNDFSESQTEIHYWDPQQQNEIAKFLLELLFSTPFEKRGNLIECFRIIIFGSFPANIDFAYQLIQLFDSHTESFQDITTILYISTFWAQACGKREYPEELNEKFEEIAIEMIKRFSQFSLQVPAPASFQILRYVSKCISQFIKKLGSPFTCETFDPILSALATSLTIPTEENQDIYLLKRSVYRLFRQLCSKLFPLVHTENPQDIRVMYSKHFVEHIAPRLLEVLVQSISHESDSYLLSSIMYLFYLFLRYNIGNQLFLTMEFITNVLIPIARLTPADIEESETNPIQFIDFDLSYDISHETRTTRTTTAALFGEILKNEQYLDDLYDYLLAPTVDQIDFEGRIFLMTKYIKATMTKYGPMITDNVVDPLAEQTKNVGAHPPFLSASLLMFMTSVLPYLDSELGCNIAAHCIINSDNPLVICTASNLLRTSIIECDQRVSLPIQQLIPKLLELSSVVRYDYLTKAVEAMIQIGGSDIYPFVKDILQNMLQLCLNSLAANDSKDCQSTLYSMFEIVNAIPDDAPLLSEISEIILPGCIGLFQQFPDNTVYDDIFLLISAFNTKLDNITPTMVTAFMHVLEIVKTDEVFLHAMKSIAFLMCPIIANQGFKENSPMIAATVANLMHFHQFCLKEEDKDLFAYEILIIATLIQSIGESGFPFIPHIAAAFQQVNDPSATCLFSACLFAFSSAAIVNPQKAFESFPQEIIQSILPNINMSTLQTYKELKMGFIFLLKAVQMGVEQAYVAAVQLLPALCERKKEHEMDLEEKMTTASALIANEEEEVAAFPPLIIPFVLPSDGIDEFGLFHELTQQSQLFSKLTPEQQQIVNQIYN